MRSVAPASAGNAASQNSLSVPYLKPAAGSCTITTLHTIQTACARNRAGMEIHRFRLAMALPCVAQNALSSGVQMVSSLPVPVVPDGDVAMVYSCSLHQWRCRCVEFHAFDIGVACEYAHVLRQRAGFAALAQLGCHFVAHELVGQLLAFDAAIDGDDVEAVPGRDQTGQHTYRCIAEDGLFEFRHGFAALQLAQVAAVGAGRAVRVLARIFVEELRPGIDLVQYGFRF